MSKARQAYALEILACIAIGAITALYISLDRHYAISLNTLVLGVVGCAGVLVFLCLQTVQSSRRYVLGLALFLTMIIAVRTIDWDSRKPFLRALAQVTPGMSRAEVEQVMSGFIQMTPASTTGDTSQPLGFRHTDEGWGNADVGMIMVQNNRVVAVQFSHD